MSAPTLLDWAKTRAAPGLHTDSICARTAFSGGVELSRDRALRDGTHEANTAPSLEDMERMAREAEFDPDYWLIGLEMREGDLGLLVVG